MSGTAAARPVGSTPRLLASDPGSEFVVRPATLSFDETWHGHRADFMGGPSVTSRQFNEDLMLGRIRWTDWGAQAVGQATYWFGPTDSCASCQWLRAVIGLHASRVRQGRYTRLTVSYRGSRFRIVYALKPGRPPAYDRGVRGPWYTWCNVAHPGRCLTP